MHLLPRATVKDSKARSSLHPLQEGKRAGETALAKGVFLVMALSLSLSVRTTTELRGEEAFLPLSPRE